MIADAVEFFKNFDFDSLQDLANQIKADSEAAESSAAAAAASESKAKTSEDNAKSSENAAKIQRLQQRPQETKSSRSLTTLAISQRLLLWRRKMGQKNWV